MEGADEEETAVVTESAVVLWALKVSDGAVNLVAKLVPQQQTFMSTTTLQGNTSPEPRFWILMQDITKYQHHQIYQFL